MALAALGALGGIAIGALGGGCVSMPFVSVGCSQDATAEIVNDLTTEVGNFFGVRAQENVSSFVSTVQKITINNLDGAEFYCPGGITIINESLINAKVMTEVNSDIVVDIQNDLITLIDNAAEALAQDQRDFLSRALGTTDNNAVAIIKNSLHTAVTNEVNIDAVTNIVNRVSVSQEIVFNNIASSFYSDNCTFTNTATTNFYAQQLITRIVRSSALTSIQQQLDNQARAEATTGKTKDKTLLYIILGSILGIGILGGIIFLIARARRNQAAAVAPQPAPPPPYAAFRPPPPQFAPQPAAIRAVAA